ncbi:hypothetical protein VPH35_082022 [Triticum aestivum]
MAICFMLALSSEDNPDVSYALKSSRHACCTLWDGRLWKIKLAHLNSWYAMTYVSHTAWIQSGKIQDNILLCKEMESEKYGRILEWYLLKKYLEIKIIGE